MLEEDSQGFKPSAVYVTFRQIPGSSSRSWAARLPSPRLLPASFGSRSAMWEALVVQNGSPADCSASFCLAFLSGLASLSVCPSPSGTHSGHRSRPPRDMQFRCRSQRPDVEAEKYLWRVEDVERINRQCSLRFVPLLNQSGKVSESTFYFTSTEEGSRKQANLVFHQDQNHRQTGLRGGEGLPSAVFQTAGACATRLTPWLPGHSFRAVSVQPRMTGSFVSTFSMMNYYYLC